MVITITSVLFAGRVYGNHADICSNARKVRGRIVFTQRAQIRDESNQIRRQTVFVVLSSHPELLIRVRGHRVHGDFDAGSCADIIGSVETVSRRAAEQQIERLKARVLAGEQLSYSEIDESNEAADLLRAYDSSRKILNENRLPAPFSREISVLEASQWDIRPCSD